MQNISIKNVPEVNYLGGVDPFLEACRISVSISDAQVQCGFSKDPDEPGAQRL